MIFFIFSLSVCNLKNYNIVFNLQRTHFTYVFIQRLKIIAFVVSVTFFRYILRVMLLSDLQVPYINDLNRPSNEKSKKSWAPIKSLQFRLDIVAIRIGPRMEKWENHEPLSNALYMSPFQVFYVACRPRVFGP